MTAPIPILFDRAARRKHVARWQGAFAQHDFLYREAAAMLEESLQVIARELPQVIVLDASGHLLPYLQNRSGTERVLIFNEMEMEDEIFPFAENSLNAVVSNLALHTVNDLPGFFVQIRRALKPDGLFLAVMPGADSLKELRQVLADTESAQRGGITPRVAPFPEVRDLGNLLQRAGFALPVVDSTKLTVTYPNLFSLLQELRGAGEANMLADREKKFTPRSLFVDAASRYAAQYSDDENSITVTAELLTLTAWKPASNQQLPAKRGSRKISFTEVF